MCKPNTSSSSLTRKIVAGFDAEKNSVMLDWEMTLLTANVLPSQGILKGIWPAVFFTLITDSRTSH